MENYGLLSLVPIILTIFLALKAKNVLIALFIGVFSASLILVNYNPIAAVTNMIENYLFVQLQDGYNAGVIVLLVYISGFVTLIKISGAAEAFAKSAGRLVNSKGKLQMASWISGIAVFFSELGTPLIVGPIFSPLYKKNKVSKEKLAWVLDTTGSPVCILIPFIGWGVYSMGLIQKEFEALSIIQYTDWAAFIAAIPFQFYAILSLFLVPIVATLGYEFGPMLKAEKNARKGIFSPAETEETSLNIIEEDHKNAPVSTIIIPLIILFVTLFALLIPLGFPFEKVDGTKFRVALITGYFFASIAIILLLKIHSVYSFKESLKIYISGLGGMFETIVILILAWSLGAIGKELGTAEYIVGLAQGNLPSWMVPAIIFLIGMVISFATGSSWGTFAIMMPIAIPMAVELEANLIVTIAAVLSGGLFGDHCSPISDTTILSSAGAECTTINHTKTQLPYAMLCGLISFVGYLIAGKFEQPLLFIGAAIILLLVYILLGKTIGEKV